MWNWNLYGKWCAKAKDAADVLCDTNENDGVAKWIKENILSNQQ